MAELAFHFFFFFLASHDRTMQDIVYKLVPGLQEGNNLVVVGF